MLFLLLGLPMLASRADADMAAIQRAIRAHDTSLSGCRLDRRSRRSLRKPQFARRRGVHGQARPRGPLQKVESGHRRHAGVFATLDAGAEKTVGLSHVRREAVRSADGLRHRLTQARRQAGLGKVLVGRGAVNQKGPQSALLAALHASCRNQKMPVTGCWWPKRRGDRLAAYRPLVHRPKCKLHCAIPSAFSGRRPAETPTERDISSAPRRGRAGAHRHGESGAWDREGRALIAQGHGRQSGVAVGAGAGHVSPPIATPSPSRLSGPADQRRTPAMVARPSRCAASQSKQLLGVEHWIDDLPWRGQRAPGLAAPVNIGVWSPAIPPRWKTFCGRAWPRWDCAWCRHEEG